MLFLFFKETLSGSDDEFQEVFTDHEARNEELEETSDKSDVEDFDKRGNYKYICIL